MITMTARVHRGLPRPILCGGDYRHRASGVLVTVLDVERRHGRPTGRVLVFETSAAVRLPFVCREKDLVPSADAGEASALPQGSRRVRRSG
jgi:hypothetical protein